MTTHPNNIQVQVTNTYDYTAYIQKTLLCTYQELFSTRRGCAEILGDRYHKLVPLPIIQTRAQVDPAIAAPAILIPTISAPAISTPAIMHMYPIDTIPSPRFTKVIRMTIQSTGCKLAHMLSTQAKLLDRLIIT